MWKNNRITHRPTRWAWVTLLRQWQEGYWIEKHRKSEKKIINESKTLKMWWFHPLIPIEVPFIQCCFWENANEKLFVPVVPVHMTLTFLLWLFFSIQAFFSLARQPKFIHPLFFQYHSSFERQFFMAYMHSEFNRSWSHSSTGKKNNNKNNIAPYIWTGGAFLNWFKVSSFYLFKNWFFIETIRFGSNEKWTIFKMNYLYGEEEKVFLDLIYDQNNIPPSVYGHFNEP